MVARAGARNATLSPLEKFVAPELTEMSQQTHSLISFSVFLNLNEVIDHTTSPWNQKKEHVLPYPMTPNSSQTDNGITFGNTEEVHSHTPPASGACTARWCVRLCALFRQASAVFYPCSQFLRPPFHGWLGHTPVEEKSVPPPPPPIPQFWLLF